ncbi:unnamed protein product [Ceutorhynchus assimilis]|uniref:Uncharacterized protein n=1 Tax=Ceutorhynchus assimilis TaxID=467358 RepID=A0A9N9MVI5_9CUCU|nr:unnamed protein product [Ceutorhynchus assimilis]
MFIEYFVKQIKNEILMIKRLAYNSKEVNKLTRMEVENFLFKLILQQLQDQHLAIRDDYSKLEVELADVTKKYNILKNSEFLLLASSMFDNKDSYTTKLKKESVIIVKPKKEQNNQDTKKEIRHRVKPGGFEYFKVSSSLKWGWDYRQTNDKFMYQFHFFSVPIREFSSQNKDFKSYRQRFENYLKLKNAFDDKDYVAQMLLNSLGFTTHSTLIALVAPEKTR